MCNISSDSLRNQPGIKEVAPGVEYKIMLYVLDAKLIKPVIQIIRNKSRLTGVTPKSRERMNPFIGANRSSTLLGFCGIGISRFLSDFSPFTSMVIFIE